MSGKKQSRAEKGVGAFTATLAQGLQSRGGGTPQEPAETRPAEVEATPAEELARLERLIERSIESYQGDLRRLQARHKQELGEFLRDINENERYTTAGYTRFGHYLKGRWGWDRSYAYRLIDLATVRTALAPLGAATVDSLIESQAREIAPAARAGGDETARDLYEKTRQSGKVTAATLKRTRVQMLASMEAEKLSPIGDSSIEDGEVVVAEIVDDDAAEQVNFGLRAAAEAAEKAVRRLDEALARDVPPYHQAEAGTDLSRIRSAVVRLNRRVGQVPGMSS